MSFEFTFLETNSSPLSVVGTSLLDSLGDVEANSGPQVLTNLFTLEMGFALA